MEPIRPESGSPSRRRTRRGITRSGTAHSTGFLKQLNEGEGTEEATFAGNAGAAQSQEITGDLENLLDAVHIAGEELANKRTYSSAERYRRAVRDFLRSVVPDSVSLQTHESVHGIMNRKRYYLLSEIDREVDRLIAGVLQTQSKQVEILTRLQKIQGMLIDIVH
jgi:uncharacterized protein YaaR (DUF327 family)